MNYFSPVESKYFEEDLDYSLEQPITSKPVPEIKNAQKGADSGGFLTSKIVGITSNPTINQVDALQTSIRLGASRVELGFMGTQKGSGNAPTPESMSSEERKMIHDLAKLNEIETTVHAAPSVSNLSGYDPRQGSFSESTREEVLNEIRRAVDFAADASTGGAVVVHWDEWQRPIETSFGLGDRNKDNLFQGYSQEYIKSETKDEDGNVKNRKYGGSEVLFVDTENDRIQTLRRDLEFTEPEIESVTLENDKNNGGSKYLKYNYKGYNESSGQVEAKKMGYDEIIKMEKEMNTGSKFKDYQEFAETNFKQLREKWKDIEQMEENTERQKKEKNDAIFLFHFMRKQADRAYEQYLSTDSMYRYHKDGGFHQRDSKQKEEDEQRRVMAWTGFQEQLNKIDKMKPIEQYSTEKAAKTVAEAAVYAWERSQGNKNLSRNLYIAPESIFPNSYGSHPDEMMSMIDKSREEMANQLLNVGAVKNKDSAKKEAEKYIRATLDIGHLNMWRRHLKRKDGESTEDFNKRFNEWAVNKSKEMAEKGYVGHGHMTDNFGFGDEHLSVGDGNAPIREFVDALRKTGKVDDFITEVGSYNANTAMIDSWSHLGISMGGSKYFQGRDSSRVPGYFNQTRHSYAGNARKPSYVFGGYAPKIGSEKWQGWAPWTGSPL